jgi:hypothetical protein
MQKIVKRALTGSYNPGPHDGMDSVDLPVSGALNPVSAGVRIVRRIAYAGVVAFCLISVACGGTSQAHSYTRNQIACAHVASGHQHMPDAERCSKVIMRAYRRATGAGATMCWVQGKAVACVPRYHVDMWQVRAVIKAHGTRWYIPGVMYPAKGTFEKAPLSGTIT